MQDELRSQRETSTQDAICREFVGDDEDNTVVAAFSDRSDLTCTPPALSGGIGEAPVRILFVDDDALVLRALQRVLRNQQGQELHFTSDPTDALRLIGELHIDVVVCDQTMPVMCGLEVLGLVRIAYPQVVRVMLTGNTERHLAIDASAGGIDRLEEKPWDNAALRLSMERLATQARGRRSDVAANAW